MTFMQLEKTELSLSKVIIIIGVVISITAAFYNLVIIPLNQIQVSLAQINSTLQDNKLYQSATDVRLNLLESSVKTITSNLGKK